MEGSGDLLAPGEPSEELDFVQVLESLGHAVVVAANRDDLPVVYVNAAFEAITGRHREDMLGRNCRVLQGDTPNQAARERFRRALDRCEQATVLVRNERVDGELFWNEVVLTPIWRDGEVTHFVAVQSDVTQRVDAQELVRKLADRDALTGLSNRRHLERRLAAEDAVAGGAAGVLYIDVDAFKARNDALGHDAGDQLLCELARRLAAVTRPTDLLARVGGDEFVVVLARPSDERGTALTAQRILEAVRHPFTIDAMSSEVTVSIGTADGPLSGAELLRRADAAMYRVKRRGGNGWTDASSGAREPGAM